MDKKELKRKAKETGADFVGVASIERFKEVPAYKNPLSIFPETKSVIIVGKRIVRGLVKGVEEGKQFKSYSCYGYVWLEDNNLSFIVYDIRYQKRGVFSDQNMLWLVTSFEAIKGIVLSVSTGKQPGTK